MGFYYITKQSLHCVDFKNGCQVNTITLPHLPLGFSYAELAMDDETHLLAISSTKKKDDILMMFVLYEYFPELVFKKMLQVFFLFPIVFLYYYLFKIVPVISCIVILVFFYSRSVDPYLGNLSAVLKLTKGFCSLSTKRKRLKLTTYRRCAEKRFAKL